MATTIEDVAKRAGVSAITASRTFSGTHPVGAATRSRVLAAAQELGYVPNLLARSLVQKQSRMIGVVVLELANPFFAPIIDAIEAVAQEKEYMVLISQSARRPEVERASIQQLRQMRVAGVIVTPASTELEHLQHVMRAGEAVVVVARRWDAGNYVTTDDFAGGRLAGEHLLGLGHRAIGCVMVDEPGHSGLQERFQGFQAALKEGGSPFSARWQITTEAGREQDGFRAADAYIDLAEKPTGVFITNDRLAMGFVHRLLEHGIRVPQDVAVVGYDDIRYAEFMEVPLTTVALPMYEMGRRAGEMLFETIEPGNGEPRQILLEPKLIVRASCGARSRDL